MSTPKPPRRTKSSPKNLSVSAGAPRARRPAAKPAASPTRKAARQAPVTPSPEAIARRAYEIFLGRNGAPGNAEADWLQAEQELTIAAPAPARRRTPRQSAT